MSYENVITLSREVSSVCATFALLSFRAKEGRKEGRAESLDKGRGKTRDVKWLLVWGTRGVKEWRPKECPIDEK